MTNLRVVLAEDHVLIRAGLRLLLEQMGGIEVVAEAGDGLEAIELIRKRQPDMVVMDVAMAHLNGLEAAERIHRDFPDVHIIMLSMHSSEAYVQQALRAGASAYLLKDAAPIELSLAIAAVRRGETYLCPTVTSQLVRRFIRRGDDPMHGLNQLTPRQRDVLRLIAEGRTMQEIGQILEISVKTVEGHRAQLMERLNIHDVPGLVRFAIREGLVSSDL